MKNRRLFDPWSWSGYWTKSIKVTRNISYFTLLALLCFGACGGDDGAAATAKSNDTHSAADVFDAGLSFPDGENPGNQDDAQGSGDVDVKDPECLVFSDCDDSDECTTDTCTVVGECNHTVVECNDNNVCTTDSCDSATGCGFVPIPCEDDTLCTTDGCDPVTGCAFTEMSCDDGDLCTEDSCDKTTGCTHVTMVCTDDSACTNDSCSPAAGCQFNAIVCEDNDGCTEDGCLPESGCTHVPLQCDDGDKCTVDTCDPLSGCTYTPSSCDDGKLCTVDGCEPALGCVYSLVNCDDNDACTQDACASLSGECTHDPVVCDDGDVCTLDNCASSWGCTYAPISECCENDQDCVAKDVCNPVVCQDNQCVATPVPGCCVTDAECDDGNECSVGVCDVGTNQCVFGPGPGGCATASDCDDGKGCTLEACVDFCCVQKDLCCVTDTDCNDGNECTSDTCNDSSCAHEPLFTPQCCTNTVAAWYFDDPFEAPWAIENSVAPELGWQVWTTSGVAQSTPGLLYYGATELMSYDFGVSSGIATSPAFTLFSNVSAQLKVSLLADVETNINFDKLTFYVLYADKKIQVWKKPTTITGDWTELTLNLSAFAGKTLRLSIEFQTVDDNGNNGFGVALDNVEVTSTCAPLTCSKAIECVDLITETFETCMAGKCIYTAP